MVILSYVYVLPVYYDIVDVVDTDVGDNLTGAGQEAYESVKTSGNNVVKYIAIVFCLMFIVWGFLKMQEKEKYTGVYGGNYYG